MDYAMFGSFFLSAECCLVLSTTHHLVGSYSRSLEQMWPRVDLLGIVIVTKGTFVPSIYYAFPCHPRLQGLYWTITTASGCAVAAMIWTPRFRRSRTVRICAYVALGASLFIPMLHGIQLYGLKYMLKHSGMRCYLLELAFYGIGAGLYAFRVPERFAHGKFDIWGSSHQISHVAVLCAMYTHTVGLMQAFTTCRTMSLCKV